MSNVSSRILQLVQAMTPRERAQVEAFAAFVLARRKLARRRVETDEITTEELMRLVQEAGSFDWLDSDSEDVYSVHDGEPVEWPDRG